MMQKEYLFFSPTSLDFPLDDSIAVLNSLDESNFLISNVQTNNAELYAPEINFYIKNTKDAISEQIKNIKKLYDARANAFDLAQDIDFEKEVGKKLLIVSNGDNVEELKNQMSEDGFTCISLPSSMILNIDGTIGDLKVKIKKEEEILELDTDQIIWYDAPLFSTKQNGTFDPNILGLEETIAKVKENDGVYKYKNFVKYDNTICQYHERREETCGKCAEVCPTIAILKIDEEKHLEFSNVDCHGCGGCVSVCPSGALDYTQMPRLAFHEISSFYKEKIALIIPRKMQIENLHVELKKGVLPLAIEGEKYLHESHMISLIQTSGNPIIFYTDFISKGTGDAISLINEIFERKYHKKAVFVCKDEEELKNAIKNAISIPQCIYGIDESELRKREIFSARLSHLISNDDLGVVKTGEHIHYGNIVINQDKCTLCLSCVGACNVRALTAHPEDNTLRFNPSICTDCGYCEFTCPEQNCLHVIKDEISLKPDYFKQNIMATDEIFKCVECGDGFATVKSVEKIAEMMKPMFGDDEVKIRTLYCCANCKPKVMLKEQVKEIIAARENGK